MTQLAEKIKAAGLLDGVFPFGFSDSFGGPNAEINKQNAFKVHSFLIIRKVMDHQERINLICRYGDSIRADKRKNKIHASICKNSITWRLFKEWIDKKVKS